MKITSASVVVPIPKSGPVKRAASALLRDIQNVCLPGAAGGAAILLEDAPLPAEQYALSAQGENIVLRAGDELGFVYGLYRVSRELLGVEPFWFWNDQRFDKAREIEVPQGWHIESGPCRVRYRGWFINDEVLLHAWRLHGSEDGPWEMAFEALLRLGGNMVIPGTDRNAHRYAALASEFGLYITHHHAEPLGARMFARAYPELTPSYAEHPELFEGLWEEGIRAQKGMRVVWNVGFRGQGDAPFWASDPRYDTPQARGALISQLIRKQVAMVHAALPGAPCCTNLYGEVMELYRQGHLDLPDDVIKIWADNGYGKMVTRRQNNHNPRIRALPEPGAAGRHGVYYHVSFYDLQAANHMTMLCHPPAFVKRELQEALSLGADDYWIVNCSNIKPHVYALEVVASLWRDGEVDLKAHLLDYAARYYGEANASPVAGCFEAYFAAGVAYGSREDERAGDQFPNYGARMLVSQWMKDAAQPSQEMRWAIDAPNLREQILWFDGRCREGMDHYAALLARCEETAPRLAGNGRTLFEDSLMLQARLLLRSYEGAHLACQSLLRAMQGDWLEAFYHAGESKAAFLAADRAMREREHDHWRGFYANDCLTDVKHSAWLMGVLMGVLRNRGDGPHFYGWQRQFMDPPEDAKVFLITNMENHLDDDALFERMNARRRAGITA